MGAKVRNETTPVTAAEPVSSHASHAMATRSIQLPFIPKKLAAM